MTPDALSSAVRPFQVRFDKTAIADLRQRLSRVRWPTELPGTGWERGVPLSVLRELATAWERDFDFEAAEAAFAAHPQFITTIEGVQIHFLQVRSPEPDARPLLLSHGWPSSPLEYLDVIGPLSNPRAHGGKPGEAFHLVIPSLPGFGFSGPVGQVGVSTGRIAKLYAALMAQLGYTRYGVQGGDFGALIAPEMGRIDDSHVAGVHLNAASVGFIPWGDVPEAELANFSPVEKQRLARLKAFSKDGNAYFQMQATRPQTIGYALNDSPVALLAFMAEKFKEWSFPASAPLEPKLRRDQVLSAATLYWLTGTGASAAHLYYENMHSGSWGAAPSKTPVGVAAFAEDFAIRRFGERGHNLVHWSDFDRGGHFAALEAPDLFVNDVRQFFGKVGR